MSDTPKQVEEGKNGSRSMSGLDPEPPPKKQKMLAALDATQQSVCVAGGKPKFRYRDDKGARDKMVAKGRAALQRENSVQLKVVDLVIKLLEEVGIRMTPEYTPEHVMFDEHFHEREELIMTQEEWRALTSSGEIHQLGGIHVVNRQGDITGWKFGGAVVEFITHTDWRTGAYTNGRSILIRSVTVSDM